MYKVPRLFMGTQETPRLNTKLSKEQIGEELLQRIQRDIVSYSDVLPERVAIAWRGYLAALIEWESLTQPVMTFCAGHVWCATFDGPGTARPPLASLELFLTASARVRRTCLGMAACDSRRVHADVHVFLPPRLIHRYVSFESGVVGVIGRRGRPISTG
jgi:hypothetical protein